MEFDLTELGIDLGEPTIKELNIPDEIDEKIETGHVFILFSGKVARKIGPKTLEIYENAEIPGVQIADPMGDFEKRMQEFASVFEQERLPQFLDEHEPFELPRYIKTKKGSSRVRPWAALQYF